MNMKPLYNSYIIDGVNKTNHSMHMKPLYNSYIIDGLHKTKHSGECEPFLASARSTRVAYENSFYSVLLDSSKCVACSIRDATVIPLWPITFP